MTFGRFVNKWRLFQRPLQVKLKNAGKVYMCAARPHNFCTNKRLSRLLGDATLEEEEHAAIYIPSDLFQRVEGNSMMQEIFVDKIYQSGFSLQSKLNRKSVLPLDQSIKIFFDPLFGVTIQHFVPKI